jgi:2-polyprenyl-3-methyl-5-hydroxy-6-metoxy-1,4-benzoquinol methylase
MDIPNMDGFPSDEEIERTYQEVLREQHEQRLRAEVAEKVGNIFTHSERIEGAQEFAEICRRGFEEQTQRLPFEGDPRSPAGLREYITYLLSVDPKVALGAVVTRVEEEYRNKMEAGGRIAGVDANTLESTYEMVHMLDMMCQDEHSTEGRARLTTLLRYMYEEHYQQGTQAMEALCSGEEQEFQGRSGKHTYGWKLEIPEGGQAIDLGCGPGKALDVLARVPGIEKVRGIDINPLHAFRDDRVKLGVIDVYQRQMSLSNRVSAERLSFEKRFGQAGVVTAMLVLDRVADQHLFLQNCSKLVMPGGTLCLGVLLPVKGEDDEPEIDQRHRLRYVAKSLTNGEDVELDYLLIREALKDNGFHRIMRRQVPIGDPVSGRTYDNHFLIVAKKRMR